MFKKSDNKGDKTPKQENKDHSAKAEATADQPAPTADKTAAPANEDKKS